MVISLNISRKKWFEHTVNSSKLPQLVAKYDLDTIIEKASSICTYAEFEILLSSCALCETGKEVEIEDDRLNEIIKECEEIIYNGPKQEIGSLNSFAHIRGLRPYWFSIPIYEEILSPFNSKSLEILKANINDIFKSGCELIREKKTTSLPQSLIELEDILTIKHSEINCPSDIWDKLFVKLNHSTIILHYKIADVIYLAICKKLQENMPKFISIKGKSLERLTKIKMETFFSASKGFHSFYINHNGIEKEKDLLFFNKKIGFCIECKSVKIRNSSSYWSKLNLIKDFNPILHALNQISGSLHLLNNGGKFYTKKNKNKINHKVKPLKNYFGFIVTDQIFTPYIRASIDEVIKLEGADEVGDYWHGKNIWLGSILDFIFLLEISTTPSVLLDYLQWIRSIECLKFTDEPEAWLSYGTEPIIPFVGAVPANIILNGFDWNRVKMEGLKTFFPFWLENLNSIKNLDSKVKIPTQN